jgi:hypothetical protein
MHVSKHVEGHSMRTDPIRFWPCPARPLCSLPVLVLSSWSLDDLPSGPLPLRIPFFFPRLTLEVCGRHENRRHPLDIIPGIRLPRERPDLGLLPSHWVREQHQRGPEGLRLPASGNRQIRVGHEGRTSLKSSEESRGREPGACSTGSRTRHADSRYGGFHRTLRGVSQTYSPSS